eukprot:10338095-Lingulodinium_polyedra.AAC.1
MDDTRDYDESQEPLLPIANGGSADSSADSLFFRSLTDTVGAAPNHVLYEQLEMLDDDDSQLRQALM